MNNHKVMIKEAIKKKQFPRLLYKYRAINDKTKSIIANGEFWFAQPKTFNDPFDCNLSETNKHSINNLRNYLKHHNVANSKIIISAVKNKPEEIRKIALKARNKVLNTRGVLSLSGVYDNILMWSHYAEEHSGLVICVDILKDLNFFDTPININYVSTYKPLNYFSNPQDSVIKNISTKSKDWSYEKEVRIYKPNYGLHTIKKDAITKIYFGAKTTKKQIKDIKLLCKNSGYISVKFFKANISYGAFKLSFSKV